LVVCLQIVGGIIDLTVFTGPNPADVVKQYHNVIGTPHMPPFWALGFHQCRWGYHDLSMVKDVVEKYAAAQIPLDTIWSDIDYMNNYLDFTWDPVRFPSASVAEYVQQLHSRGQHYVVIVDPGISNTSAHYAPYVQGLQQNVFIQRASGGEFHGKVWPGYTAFPDWFAANASSWWRDQIQSFVGTVPYDGLWIDMNEISNCTFFFFTLTLCVVFTFLISCVA
jgi:alpha-glucosidase (family GH31 glycosyl hydrolase)